MKTMYRFALAVLMGGYVLTFSACFNDLDTTPLDEDQAIADVVYEDPTTYKRVLAKLYAGLAVSGQQGPAGQPDISGIDEGFSTYIRQYWKAQELTTDEAVIAWNDGNIHDYEEMDWNAQNEFITAMYNRIYYQISLCNEFLRESTEAKLAERGQSNIGSEVQAYRAEARFLRALSYWHALDMFRNVPFVTDANAVGAFFPEQIAAVDLFQFIEEEIKAIEGDMVAPRANQYGRADQAALWMLAAKLYLNAEVYTGQARYNDALDYSKRVIDAGFMLDPDYEHLFLADNNTSPEIIFPVLFDGLNTRTWGGMTFVIHAAIGGDMDPAEFGVDSGWGGTRATSAFVNKFPTIGGGQVIVERAPQNDTYDLLNVPGAYQNWDPANNANALASINNDGVYEGYIYLAEGGEFKFALGGWDTNWGDSGADGTLDPGGDNLTAEAGFYRINVDLNTLAYSITPTTWGLIGDATGSWDMDTDMTYSVEEGAWVLNTSLTRGEIKFRANDAWDTNFGDNGSDGTLEYNGANIVIPRDGNYQIKLYLGRPDYSYSLVIPSSDGRAMFFTEGQSLEIDDVSQFTDGYAVTKFKNITSTGATGSDVTFPDTDFPVFRLADAYLMYAEAVLRGANNGSLDQALEYVNLVRNRAYGGEGGAILRSELTLDFIIDERARELGWEMHRRTDLVRFGLFTGGEYVWPLKGGTPEGTAVPDYLRVFPIPSSDLGANPNLTQNPGYAR